MDTLFCFAPDGVVVGGPHPLPHSWRNISGLPALSLPELAALGWLPVADEHAALGPRQRHGAPALTVEPARVLRSYPAEDIPPPAAVTMRQARLALLAAGRLDDVTAAINALPEPQRSAALIEWEYAQEVRRDWPWVAALAGALDLDDAALDALFVAAEAL